jgi:hypothetical protein
MDELLVAGKLLGLLEPRVATEVVALVALDRVPVGVRKVHEPAHPARLVSAGARSGAPQTAMYSQRAERKHERAESRLEPLLLLLLTWQVTLGELQ